MKNKTITKRLLSMALAVVMMLNCIPFSAFATPLNMADSVNDVETVADPGTAATWQQMLGTNADGNRYAGRVWADKSVYIDGQTAQLRSGTDSGSSFKVELQDDEAFQVIYSVLGSSMTTTETTTTSGPMDVVLVLDTSTSMDDEVSGSTTRLELTINAANKLLDEILQVDGTRVAIVTYNYDSETVLNLAEYTNGVNLVVNEYKNNNDPDAGVVYAYDDSNVQLGKDSGYTMGTNLQAGIYRGFNILADATNTAGRTPVAIVLTDGEANRVIQNRFYNIGTNVSSQSDRRLYLGTLLTAAWGKSMIEANYGKAAKTYSVGVDLNEDGRAHVLMNPGDSTNGFNASNSSERIRLAYTAFTSWAAGNTVDLRDSGDRQDRWIYDHNFPNKNGRVTTRKIAANINWVGTDAYYDVSSASLEDAFCNQMY